MGKAPIQIRRARHSPPTQEINGWVPIFGDNFHLILRDPLGAVRESNLNVLAPSPSGLPARERAASPRSTCESYFVASLHSCTPNSAHRNAIAFAEC